MQRRRLDQVLEPSFVADLDAVDLDELRDRRAQADDVETELSYYRRMLHGRMDLLAFEMRRRSGEETRTLLEALPEILGGGDSRGEGAQHRPGSLAPDLPLEGHRTIDRVLDDDFLSRLPSLSDEEVAEIQETLSETEQEVSGQRRQVQAAFDQIQAEILRRYKEGKAETEIIG
ncbi:MAG: aerial mycelium formation protein [Acidimicrobiia bacterium]